MTQENMSPEYPGRFNGLWKVDDLATKDLMVDYYHRLVSREGRSEALRQAQLAMLSDPERRHPFY